MPDFLPIAGVRLATAAAGIRYQDRDDLLVMELAQGSTCAAVFTTNAFCAAPVVVAREHLATTSPRYLLVNSGNANAGTGSEGLRATRETCKSLAAAAGCAMNQVLPFSTGVIGEDLPTAPFSSAIPGILAQLEDSDWPAAAGAIMTTDTVPKLASRQIGVNGKSVSVTGIAKGSGMICPDMATMLAFIATDAEVPQSVLQGALESAVADSFNAITVDGDTSTNDACVLAATGASGVHIDADNMSALTAFESALTEVCMELAGEIVRDGEGATKLVNIVVASAKDRNEARRVGYTIAHSPLVKTALFAADPNWGRILAAVGRTGIDDLDINGVTIALDDVEIVRNGGRAPEYTEAAGEAVFAKSEFSIRVGLGRGGSSARILTCDLSYDYVKINAEYRT